MHIYLFLSSLIISSIKYYFTVVDDAENHGFRSQRNWGNLKYWQNYCCVKNMGFSPKFPKLIPFLIPRLR